MTSLHILGSGSRGNAIAVAAEGAVLLVDAGFSARELERRLATAELDPRAVVGIALTHEHGDHAAGAIRFAQRTGCVVLASPGTWRRVSSGRPAVPHLPLGARGEAEAGPFRIAACATSHDAVEPLALAIRLPGGPSVGVAYDLGRPTQGVRYLLRGHHALVLEANHDELLLRTSGYPPVVQQRIAGAGGHLSNRDAAELLQEVVHAGLGHVVLAHLSERCNSEAAARAAIEPALRRARFTGRLHVARQDHPLEPIPLLPVHGPQFGLGV